MFGYDLIGYCIYEHDERELERWLREMECDFEDDQEEEEEY